MKAKRVAIKEQDKGEIGLSDTFLENAEGKFEERKKEKKNIPSKQEGESKSVIIVAVYQPQL